MSSGRAIRHDQGLVPADVAGGDRRIPLAQAYEHFSLLASGYQPQNVPCPIEDGIRQRHPPSALVNAGQGNVRVGYVEDRISGNKRRSMAIGPKAKVY